MVMKNLYLDIETMGFNPESDAIVTVQTQEFDCNGIPTRPLVIRKAWEKSEEEICKEVHELIVKSNKWSHILVGYNLIFDLTFLFKKFEKYGLGCPSVGDFIFERPIVDAKYSIIMANGMQLKGSGLSNWSTKKVDGNVIPMLYCEEKYEEIITYITEETQGFMGLFEKLIKTLKTIKS